MKLDYYEWGERGNPTLFFLNGMGSSGLSFGELSQLILYNYNIVSLDLPGHGGKGSLPNEKDYLPTSLAEHLSNFMDSLGLTNVFLVGHSWGAHLALYVAGFHPGRINGLILLDGGYLQQDVVGDSLEKQLENVDVFTENVRYSSWEAFLESEKADYLRWSKEIENGCLAQVTEIDGEIRLAVSSFTAKAVIKGIYQEPTARIFPKVLSPVLLLRSTLPKEVENSRRQAIEYLVKEIPQAEVHAIPNTSHDIYRDAPEIIADKIHDWVTEVYYQNL